MQLSGERWLPTFRIIQFPSANLSSSCIPFLFRAISVVVSEPSSTSRGLRISVACKSAKTAECGNAESRHKLTWAKRQPLRGACSPGARQRRTLKSERSQDEEPSGARAGVILNRIYYFLRNVYVYGRCPFLAHCVCCFFAKIECNLHRQSCKTAFYIFNFRCKNHFKRFKWNRQQSICRSFNQIHSYLRVPYSKITWPRTTAFELEVKKALESSHC